MALSVMHEGILSGRELGTQSSARTVGRRGQCCAVSAFEEAYVTCRNCKRLPSINGSLRWVDSACKFAKLDEKSNNARTVSEGKEVSERSKKSGKSR